MRIPKALILDPERNAVFAITAVAISLFVFAYSTIYGKVAVLAFYACWLPPLILDPRILTRGMSRILPLLILPSFALFSTVWSDQSGATLRASIQYGTTILCGLVAARLVSLPILALGGLLGSILVLSYSYANGEYSYDVVDGSYAFAGAFSSKNQLGYFASLALVFALATLWLFRAQRFWRLVAVGVGIFAIVTLARADSATSTLTTLGTLAVIACARLLFAFPPQARRVSIAILLAGGLGGLFIAWEFGAFEQVFQVFGKDATLTGRTYLWQKGIEIGGERPLAGLGYYAFWTPGRPMAEELWAEFYIDARTGFHFHNTIVEAYVGMGMIGVLLVLGVLAALIVMPMRVLLNRRVIGGAIVCAGLSVLYVVRSLVEIDFLTPYTAGSFLVPYLILQMSDQRAAETAAIGTRETTIGERVETVSPARHSPPPRGPRARRPRTG